jgi:hypothetical protein
VSNIQKKLFPEQERQKLLQARLDRITVAQWRRFYGKGWDPAYLLNIEKDDIPTYADVWRRADGIQEMVSTAAAPAVSDFPIRRLKAVVLSKGPEDQNRRIIAIGDGGWLFGLFVGLLQRQVREGTMATQGKCYSVITLLENDEMREVVMDIWSSELMLKRKL